MDPSETAPEPPEYLNEVASAFWRSVVTDYRLEPWQFFVLRATSDALHRSELARRVLDDEGATYRAGGGLMRQRPEVNLLRDSRTAFLRGCRELCLDVDEGGAPRPPRAGGGAGR